MAESLLRRRLVVSLLAMALLCALGVVALQQLGARPEPPAQTESVARPVAVRTVPLERVDYREKLSGYGRASALRSTRVAAEVAGLVTWVSPELEAGGSVGMGDELVRLDDRDLGQTLAAARARVAAVAAEEVRLQSDLKSAGRRLGWADDELQAARRELDRLRKLSRREAVTRSEVDRQAMQTSLREATYLQVEGQRDSLAAQLKRNAAEALEAAAAVARAQNDLDRAVVKPPYAGRIVSRLVQKGARVAPGTVLFEIIDLSRIELAVALPASRYGEVSVGAAATVRPSAEATRGFLSKVSRIAPLVEGIDRTFFVYLVLEQEGLPPGAFVVAEIDGPLFRGVFVLPRTAFVGERVFLAVDGVARARRPRPRRLLPHAMLVDEGFQEGEQLITSNLEEVADGTRVLGATVMEPD